MAYPTTDPARPLFSSLCSHDVTLHSSMHADSPLTLNCRSWKPSGLVRQFPTGLTARTSRRWELLHDDLAGLGAGVSSRIGSLGARSKAFMAKVLDWTDTDAPLMRRSRR